MGSKIRTRIHFAPGCTSAATVTLHNARLHGHMLLHMYTLLHMLLHMHSTVSWMLGAINCSSGVQLRQYG